jgi:hypothetical protein
LLFVPFWPYSYLCHNLSFQRYFHIFLYLHSCFSVRCRLVAYLVYRDTGIFSKLFCFNLIQIHTYWLPFSCLLLIIWNVLYMFNVLSKGSKTVEQTFMITTSNIYHKSRHNQISNVLGGLEYSQCRSSRNLLKMSGQRAVTRTPHSLPFPPPQKKIYIIRRLKVFCYFYIFH